MDENHLKAKNYALRCLSAKSYYSEELRRAMRKKGHCETSIEEIVAECFRLGYLDDEEWLQVFVKSQFSRSRSPLAIAAKLAAKGVPAEKRKELLENLEPSLASITDLLQSKYSKRDLNDFKERQKVIAALARRGFRFEDILAAIQQACLEGTS